MTKNPDMCCEKCRCECDPTGELCDGCAKHDCPCHEKPEPTKGWTPEVEEAAKNAEHIFTPPPQEWEREFVEAGANIEHARWASWQKYLHSKCDRDKYGNLVINASWVRALERQIATPYTELTESEKESDRKETRNYLPLITRLLASRESALRERIAERIKSGVIPMTLEGVEPKQLFYIALDTAASIARNTP